jgi:hypothetical protein
MARRSKKIKSHVKNLVSGIVIYVVARIRCAPENVTNVRVTDFVIGVESKARTSGAKNAPQIVTTHSVFVRHSVEISSI